jgi:hypothetical protein
LPEKGRARLAAFIALPLCSCKHIVRQADCDLYDSTDCLLPILVILASYSGRSGDVDQTCCGNGRLCLINGYCPGPSGCGRTTPPRSGQGCARSRSC